MCRGCPTSNYINLQENELELIEKGLICNAEKKHRTVSYPWIKDRRNLKDKLKVAIARMKTENITETGY